jgi:hypothetical protein
VVASRSLSYLLVGNPGREMGALTKNLLLWNDTGAS